MNRQFWVAMLLVAGVAIATANAWASVPDPMNSTVEWRRLVCNDTKAFVCPAGDGSTMFVTLRDQFNAPMAGILVQASFDADCDMCVCYVPAAFTDMNGEAYLAMQAGLHYPGPLVPDPTPCCVVTTTVRALGVTLHTDTKEWLSPDMTQTPGSECYVEGMDYASIAWNTVYYACRSDFNCDGVVDSLNDMTTFQAHWHHTCDLVDVRPNSETPIDVVRFSQNYPNPFNPFTQLEFSLTQPGRVVLRILDIAGRPVRTLVDGWREPQRYEIAWDGRDDAGKAVASGVYFCQLEAPGHKELKKMVLLK